MSAVQLPSTNPDFEIQDDLVLLSTNLDDITSEHLAFCMETLLEMDDVVDCWSVPIFMKKNRPAFALHCLVRQHGSNGALTCLFRHTTTLGVRIQDKQHGLRRAVLRRHLHSTTLSVNGQSHTVRVKVAYLGSEIVSIKPEFEDCKAVANIHDSCITLAELSHQAVQCTRQQLAEKKHEH